MKEQILALLKGVIHPESEQNIVDGSMVEQVAASEAAITVSIRFPKGRDPFAVKIKNQAETILKEHFPEAKVLVMIKEGGQKKLPDLKEKSTTGDITKVIAVASGKGGVGKSTVAANLAVSLRNLGFRVGLLDADIYGPSQPKMFGVEGYIPDAEEVDGMDLIVPAVSEDISIMSIGFFIRPTDALLWRGAMAVNALKQMIHQTKWGPLDFLVCDLPPGTGDIHLSIIGEMQIDAAVIVSTPQQVAVADVVRGVEMFRNEQVHIPVAGIIENMAYFTPEELPNNKYYIFGKGGAKKVAEEYDVPFLGEVPIIQSIMEGGDSGRPGSTFDERVEEVYREIADKIVGNVMKNG
ncbi:MAG: Mrp/NBP35 family ATP-binding protein [Alistipes sp.]|nr:Mrp/NBP35 family ATP-binding protein [Alistipes sp.]